MSTHTLTAELVLRGAFEQDTKALRTAVDGELTEKTADAQNPIMTSVFEVRAMRMKPQETVVLYG